MLVQCEVVARVWFSSSSSDELEDWVEVASCCVGVTDGCCVEGDGPSSIYSAGGDSSSSDVECLVPVG